MKHNKKQTNEEIDGLEVTVAKTKKAGIKQPTCVEAGILPKLHFSMLVVGRSGSGKSNVVIHLLRSKALLNGCFNFIFYLCGSPDDSFKQNVKIPPENIIDHFDEEFLQKLIEKQKNIIQKKGIVSASKTNSICLIFDDILGHPKFLRSKMLMKLVTEGRHFLITSFFNTQSYKKIPRSVRINCRGVIFFPSTRGEMEVFAEEQCLPNMTKKRFLELVDYCTSQQYQFAFIQADAPPMDRLRKNFNKIIN
jgi:hypothetical protein